MNTDRRQFSKIFFKANDMPSRQRLSSAFPGIFMPDELNFSSSASTHLQGIFDCEWIKDRFQIMVTIWTLTDNI